MDDRATERELLTYDAFGLAVRQLGQTIADVTYSGLTLRLLADWCADHATQCQAPVTPSAMMTS